MWSIPISFSDCDFIKTKNKVSVEVSQFKVLPYRRSQGIQLVQDSVGPVRFGPEEG